MRPIPLTIDEIAAVAAFTATHAVTMCPLGAVSIDPIDAVPLGEMIRRECTSGKAKWMAIREQAERRREKALPMLQAGRPHREIAVEMGVSVGTIHCYARQLRDAGRL